MTGGWTGVWPASGASVPTGGGGGRVGAADGAAVAEEFGPGALAEFVPGAEDSPEGGTAEGGVLPGLSAIIIARVTAMTTRTSAATTTATRRRALPAVAVDTAS
jgi:hypothetical protein